MALRLDRLHHPHFTAHLQEWCKFRLVMEGGDQFKHYYLKKFTTREPDPEFCRRRDVSYVPAHAKAAIFDVRNSIFRRMIDITRVGGPTSYQEQILGLMHGVDAKGNSMNSYIGTVILEELLALGRVGVYVDKPPLGQGLTLREASDIRPYLFHYVAEDIVNWHYDHENMLDVVLLRDHHFVVDEDTGLTIGEQERFRLLKRVETPEGPKVLVQFHGFGDGRRLQSPASKKLTLQDEYLLDLPEIPFVLFELSDSLLKDAADYQIALMNIASSDLQYILKANFPFYVEQYNPQLVAPHLRHPGVDGTSTEAAASNARETPAGVSEGRQYPIGAEQPAFIHPSSEPLLASMQKQKGLQEEIRQLINLSLANIRPVRASAESKAMDNLGLEAGLAAIGLVLEFGERNIGRIWHHYEGSSGDEVTVKYPDSYDLRTEEDRRKEAEELRKLLPTIPSETYQKAVAKEIVNIMVGHKAKTEDLEEMFAEIDESPVVVTDPDIIKQDHEQGFVSDETASRLRGYPPGEVEQARKDHAARAIRIAAAQSSVAVDRAAARGVPDLDANPNSGEEERDEANDPTLQETVTDRTRGQAAGVSNGD